MPDISIFRFAPIDRVLEAVSTPAGLMPGGPLCRYSQLKSMSRLGAGYEWLGQRGSQALSLSWRWFADAD